MSSRDRPTLTWAERRALKEQRKLTPARTLDGCVDPKAGVLVSAGHDWVELGANDWLCVVCQKKKRSTRRPAS